MKIAVVGNFSDQRCGFQNWSVQHLTALARAGHTVWPEDATYSQIYARLQTGIGQYAYLSPEAYQADVIHIIWHPATMNHLTGATWPTGPGTRPLLSLWNGCPQASCLFTDAMDVRWAVIPIPRDMVPHRSAFYAVPDWIDDLPPAPPAQSSQAMTVGYTGVRNESLAELQAICTRHDWTLNLRPAGEWNSVEDEIRRMARSVVNVAWYSREHDDRSGGVMMALASGRPQVVNHVRMFEHLEGRGDLYWGTHPGDLEALLLQIEEEWRDDRLTLPTATAADFSWTRLVATLEAGWRETALAGVPGVPQ